jgi:hypothetical protein
MVQPLYYTPPPSFQWRYEIETSTAPCSCFILSNHSRPSSVGMTDRLSSMSAYALLEGDALHRAHVMLCSLLTDFDFSFRFNELGPVQTPTPPQGGMAVAFFHQGFSSIHLR